MIRRMAAMLLGTLLLVGCSTVPDSGPAVDFTRVAEPGNQVRETAPDPGLGPLEIVRGFISANARIDQDPTLAAAKSYLAPVARDAWQQESTDVIILTATPRFDVVDDSPPTIVLSGSSDGYLQPDGAYVPTERTSYTTTFVLDRVDGEWRITRPPDALLLTLSDFNLAYTQRHVYFLNPTSTLVVPDRRWLPNRSQFPVTMASVLIGRLAAGPSEHLVGAVRNHMRTGVLRAPVTAGADGVLEVDLSGVAAVSSGAAHALAAQLVYTLRADAANIRILVDGAPLDPNQSVWTTSVLGAFDPDAVPGSGAPTAQGYYINDDGAVVNLRGVPIWGNAGNGTLNATTAAMSAATGDLAVVGTSATGNALYIGAPVTQTPMEERLTAPTISPPTFSRAGDEVWVILNGDTTPEVIRVLTAGNRYAVDSALLAGLGEVTGAALSPDGVHIAIIAGARLYMATVHYASDPDAPTPREGTQGSTATSISTPVQLRSELVVGRVVWADSQNLLVTASDATSTYRAVWRIGLDGRQRAPLTTRGLFADVDAIAATGGQPLLISSGGWIYRLEGDDSIGEWINAHPDGEAVSGSWPFYPA